MLKLLKLLVLISVFTVGAAFAYINPGDVTISYYFGELRLPLGMLLFLLFGIGLVVGALLGIAGQFRLRGENLQLRRRSELAHQEINNLRALPLRDR